MKLKRESQKRGFNIRVFRNYELSLVFYDLNYLKIDIWIQIKGFEIQIYKDVKFKLCNSNKIPK